MRTAYDSNIVVLPHHHSELVRWQCLGKARLLRLSLPSWATVWGAPGGNPRVGQAPQALSKLFAFILWSLLALALRFELVSFLQFSGDKLELGNNPPPTPRLLLTLPFSACHSPNTHFSNANVYVEGKFGYCNLFK